MIDRLKALERWVHEQDPIVSSISHFVILAVSISVVGSIVGGLMQLAGAGGVVIMLGVLAALGIGAYAMREEMNRQSKGTRQAIKDGDTIFGPDFILAVAGAVAGFTIARAILGV